MPFLPGNENERARHIRLHERVNALPDPNYSTLKYLMGHLHKCVIPSLLPRSQFAIWDCCAGP